MLNVWRFLRGIPAFAYALAGCVALGALLVAERQMSIDRAYERGKTETLAAAHFDSTLVALVDRQREAGAARVDTVRDTVRVRVERVRDVIVRVPDSIRVAVPVVDTLVIESRALVASVDSLARALDAERAANALALTVTRGQITESRLETARQAAMVQALSKRPTRAQAVLVGIASAGVGVIGGKVWR